MNKCEVHSLNEVSDHFNWAIFVMCSSDPEGRIPTETVLAKKQKLQASWNRQSQHYISTKAAFRLLRSRTMGHFEKIPETFTKLPRAVAATDDQIRSIRNTDAKVFRLQ
jgi:hypothetical protein